MRSHRPTRAPRRRRRRRQPEFGRRGGKAWDASASIGAMWARTWDTCSATASAERQPTTSLIARLKPSRYGKAFRATSKASRYVKDFALRACKLPVELRAEPPEPRRNDRGRVQERPARDPVDVRRRVRVGQIVAVDEHRQRPAGRDLEQLLDACVEEDNVVLLP